MDHQIKLNYPAIFVSGIAYWLVQAVWYILLGGRWLEAIGKTAAEMQQKGNSPIPFIGSLVCDIIVACVLAWIIVRVGNQSAMKGAAIGATLSLGIVSTILMTNYLFEQRPISLFLINSGAPLLGMTLMGTILGAWKAKAQRVAAVTA